jgi:hypothetical protein
LLELLEIRVRRDSLASTGTRLDREQILADRDADRR